MKKVMMMMAMLAVSFAVQAQSKFHDIEANEATGPVKSIKMNMMGQDIVINFSKEGKMQSESIKDAVYDAEGFLQSAKRTMMQGQAVEVKYKWENGHIVSQSMNMMGRDVEIKLTYNEKGAIDTQIMNMGGQEMNIPCTDYKYDNHGNWISRKSSMMGREIEQTRKIEYYE